MESFYKKGRCSVASIGNSGELSRMIIYAIGNICTEFQLVPNYFPIKPVVELQRPDSCGTTVAIFILYYGFAISLTAIVQIFVILFLLHVITSANSVCRLKNIVQKHSNIQISKNNHEREKKRRST